MSLAPYAVNEENSRGRIYPVYRAHDRNAFERDYTRILHSSAFRRLQGKTQVFSAILGDKFRTRLTHSLEVEQTARSIARRLDLNTDLAGVLAIAHDIGHAPFGHTGQDVLNELMHEDGGFEHNMQALRLVDELESPYPEHNGLNLMFETREGLLKHCTKERARKLGAVAERHLNGSSPTLEAQVVDWADAIAYTHADLEDAISMRILTVEQLLNAPGYKTAWDVIQKRNSLKSHPSEADLNNPLTSEKSKSYIKSAIRMMMSTTLDDLVTYSRAVIEREEITSLDDVRKSSPLIQFSPEMNKTHFALKKFSRDYIYSHPKLEEMRVIHRKVLKDLFNIYKKVPSEMNSTIKNGVSLKRSVVDYISGMTDRFAVDEHARLIELYPSFIENKINKHELFKVTC
jgi:dGTPase